MAELNTLQKLEHERDELDRSYQHYLERFGWKKTCRHFALWMWERPSPDEEGTLIVCNQTVALSITERWLDEEVPQDGDPDTPVLTAEEYRD